MILILGVQTPQTRQLKADVQALGYDVRFVHTDHFPHQLQFSLYETIESGKLYLGEPSSAECIPTADVQAVYWSYYHGVSDRYTGAEQRQLFEISLRTLFLMLPCRWVNPPHAVFEHQFKIVQLHQVAQQLGITVPKSLFGNCGADLKAFYEQCGGDVLAKSLVGLASYHRVQPEDLEEPTLSGLQAVPTLFQEYIKGRDIRVHVMGEHVFACEIISDAPCFKFDPDVQLVPFDLPEAIVQQCRSICQKLQLSLTGIDFRLTDKGQYVFLEANPSPDYFNFETVTGQPMSLALAHLLAGH